MTTSQKTKRRPSLIAANIAGTLGYFSVLLQWTWTLLILCYPLLTADHSALFPPHPVQPVHATNQVAAPSPIGILAAVIVTAFILTLTIIVLSKLPKAIGKRGAQITHRTANVVIPIMVRHKTLSKAKRKRLSYRIILVLKLLSIVLPVIGLFFTHPIGTLTGSIIWAAGLYCAAWSIFYFAIQLGVGFVSKASSSEIW